MPTATTRGAGYLIQTEIVEHEKTRFVSANRNNNTPKSLDEPIPTATTAPGGGNYMVEAEAKPFMLGQQSGGAPRSTEEPAPTVAGDGAIALVRPTIIHYYGMSYAQHLETTLTSITKCNKHALVQFTPDEYNENISEAGAGAGPLAEPVLIQLNHGNGKQGDRGNDRRVQPMENPLPAITTSRGLGLAEPALVEPIIILIGHGRMSASSRKTGPNRRPLLN